MSLVEQIMFLRGMTASSSVDMAAGGSFRLLSLTSKGTKELFAIGRYPASETKMIYCRHIVRPKGTEGATSK